MGDIVQFVKANKKLLHSMFYSDVSHISVGYDDPTKWCDFMKLKINKPSKIATYRWRYCKCQ